MKRFEKIAKRYALANSYFKNRLLIWPDTLCEIHDYLQQHGELPFRYDGDNWPYDALCEQQKRRGVRLSQYLTPDATARQIAALAVRYFENDSRIMDVCCGTGQLTRALIAAGVHPSQIVGLEVDRELADFYARLYPVTQTLIGPYRDIDFRCENIVANPPFETTEVVDFLSWLFFRGLRRYNSRATGVYCCFRTVSSTNSAPRAYRKRCGNSRFCTVHLCRNGSRGQMSQPK